MPSLLGVNPIRFWWLRRRVAVPDGAPEATVVARLGQPGETIRTADGEWWKYPLGAAGDYDVSYSVMIAGGRVITSAWASSLRRPAGAG